MISALVSSGLPTDKFTFLGFLPKKTAHRIKILKNVNKANNLIRTTYVLFVAPHDILEILYNLKTMFGDIDIVIARELTKIFEEIKRDKISNLIAYYLQEKPKGEMVVLFNTG